MQEPRPQAPPEQFAVPLATGGQTVPQVPQLVRLEPRLVSQPLKALPSQLPKPAMQAPSPQTPAVHVALALSGRGHAVPQEPQLSTVIPRLVSQPLAVLPSQSP